MTNFAIKSKMRTGRPSTYKEEYCDMIIDFFYIEHTKQVQKFDKDGNSYIVEVANSLPTFERFAVSIDVHRETLRNWCNEYPDFFAAYKKAQDLQKDMLIDLAIRGLYNPTFSIFTAKNITDMKDKVETENINHNYEMTPEKRAERIAELKRKLNDNQ